MRKCDDVRVPAVVAIDDSGWGDLVGSCVIIGATGDRRFASRLMGHDYFHNPRFKRQDYLGRAAELVEEIVDELNADQTTKIYICRGYVLSRARKMLRGRGFDVEEASIVGAAQDFAEREYNRHLESLGCPRHQGEMLRWLKSDLKQRSRYAKTGWKAYDRMIR